MPALNPNLSAAHCSLNVGDLNAAVAFYRALFGQEPAKRMADYTKFELADPPLVLSLIPMPRSGMNPINHVGLRLATVQQMEQMQQRLALLGIETQREEGVECCYSRQTKFWAADPDGTQWEIYVIHSEAATLGLTQPAQPLAVAPGSGTPPVVWTHRLTDGVATTIALEDHSADEVLFEGTINLKQSPAQFLALSREALRVLKAGGRLSVHGLVASKPLPASGWKLPGPASLVQRIPVEAEPMLALAQAGFANLHYAKLGARPNFVVGGVEMRELLLVGEKPAAIAGSDIYTVVYRGPFSSLSDADGQVYERGRRAYVDALKYEQLRSGPASAQFVFLQAPDGSAACTPGDGCC